MTIEWRAGTGLVPYPDAVREMEARVAGVRAGTAGELVWLLEHPPLYTAGTSAAADELTLPARFPVYRSGRGGRFTYHGPGQRVAYLVLDLGRRGRDLRAYVQALESWVIRTLARLGVRGETRPGRIGIWVVRPDGSEAKIGAIGVRVRGWVAFHGVAINLDPDLSHFAGIVPCGIREHGVTSLAAEGVAVSMADLDRALRACFEEIPALAGT
jgi:lipoyl(octanoyl) transferase